MTTPTQTKPGAVTSFALWHGVMIGAGDLSERDGTPGVIVQLDDGTNMVITFEDCGKSIARRNVLEVSSHIMKTVSVRIGRAPDAGKTPSELAAEVERLTTQVESLTVEVEEESHIQGRMAQLLAGAIVAIRGPEPELTRWGYHDLPERVRDVVAQRDALLVAAKKYFDGYCVDEADDTFDCSDFGEDTGCTRDQHDDAVALRAAIHQCEGAKA